MLVTGLTSIAEDDAAIGGEAKFYDDQFVAGHRRLTDAVHDEGAKIIMQTAMVDGLVDELATDEVEGVVRQFGEAAARADLFARDGRRGDHPQGLGNLQPRVARKPEPTRRLQGAHTRMGA